MRFDRYIFLILSFTIYSCSSVMYSNVGQNVTFLKNRGESSLSINYSNAILSQNTISSGLSLNYAHAFTDKYGIHGNINYSFFNYSGLDYSHVYGELGFGRLMFLKLHDHSYSEVFVGVGFMSLHNDESINANNYYEIRTSFLKPYIQPSFGTSKGKTDFAFTPRIGWVHYLNYNLEPSTGWIGEEYNKYFKEQKNTFVFEPGITLQIGNENLKFRIQYVYSTFGLFKPDYYHEYDNSILIFGLNCHFGTKSGT